MHGVTLRKFGLISIIPLFLAACDSPEERAEDHFQRGQQLAEAGDITKAVLEFRNTLQLDETRVDARYAYAVILIEQKNLRAALEQLKAVVNQDPTYVPARLRMAELFLIGGALDDALAMTEAALEQSPQDPEVLAVNATVHYRRGETAKALKGAAAALAIDPTTTSAVLVRVAERIDNGVPSEAIGLLDAAIEAAPEDGALHLVRLNILNELGDRRGTEAQLRRLIEIFPDDGNLPITLARLRFREGDRAEAEALLRASAAKREDDSKSALAVVQFLREVDGEDAARAELESLSKASPDRVDYVIALAAAEFNNGEQEEAIARLQSAIQREDAATGAKTRARTALASMLIVRGELIAAEQLLNETLAADAEDAEALTLRGRVLLDLNKTEPSLADLRNALKQRPSSPTVLLLMAQANQRLGNSAQAEDNLSQAARASGYAAEPVRRYIVQLISTGRPDIAEKVLDDALAANGQRGDLLAAIGEIRLSREDWIGARRAGQDLRAVTDGDTGLNVAADRILAAALAGEGKTDQSVELLERSWQQAGGGDPLAVRALTDAYLRSGQQDRAIQFLDRVIEEYPDNVDALVQRSRVHLAARDIASAEEVLKRAIAAEPTNANPRMALLQVLAGTGRNEAAIEEARKGLEMIEGEMPSMRLILALQLSQMGRDDEALVEYEALYEQYPSAAPVANNLASLLVSGEPTEEDIERAYLIARPLRSEPTPQFRETYGWTLFLRGNTREAITVLESTLSDLSDDPLARLHLGLAYEKGGQLDDARRTIEKALQLADAGAAFSKRDVAEAALTRLTVEN